MKINYILNYLTKNKIIIAFLIILFTIFFHLSIFHITNSREGFSTDDSIGEYDYLAPLVDQERLKKNPEEEENRLLNLWSDDTWKDFVSKWNANNCPSGTSNNVLPCLTYPPGDVLIDKNGPSNGPRFNQKFFPPWYQISEPEAKYYGKNGYFPYNRFIMNSITENPDIFTQANAGKDPSGNPYTLDRVKQIYSNRLFYLVFIKSRLRTIKNDSSDPLSYQIFEGRAKPPSSSLTSKPPDPPPSSPVSSLFSPPSTSSSTKSSPISSLFSFPS